MFGKRITGTGRRRQYRREALHAASVGRGPTTARVVARDVCSSGARLYGVNLPAPGTRVAVAIGAVDAIGHVRWSDGSSCGIAFIEPIEARQVQAIARKERT
jgi:hypothetical protein